MHNDLLERSPLLVWPLAAMFVFLAVWVVAAIRAMTRSPEELMAAARLPLEPEARRERR
ncbi:MAG TPA: hypothetical protein VEK07_22360 [Polyangiaceae bacterium]|nr:hypothetical protein [Polyangiaceae bacterium]